MLEVTRLYTPRKAAGPTGNVNPVVILIDMLHPQNTHTANITVIDVCLSVMKHASTHTECIIRSVLTLLNINNPNTLQGLPYRRK